MYNWKDSKSSNILFRPLIIRINSPYAIHAPMIDWIRPSIINGIFIKKFVAPISLKFRINSDRLYIVNFTVFVIKKMEITNTIATRAFIDRKKYLYRVSSFDIKLPW